MDEFKSIPIDEEMAKSILYAINIAEGESLQSYEDEITQRILRVIKVVYPNLKEWECLDDELRLRLAMKTRSETV